MAKTLTRSKKKSAMNTKKRPMMKRKVGKVMKKAKKVMARKKLVKKIVRKATKKLIRASAGKKSAVQAGALGKVVHYYDRIGVAIVELTGPVMVGDLLTFRRGKREFTQPVSSMQINHQPVEKAGKKQVVGIKVVQIADSGTLVLRG